MPVLGFQIEICINQLNNGKVEMKNLIIACLLIGFSIPFFKSSYASYAFMGSLNGKAIFFLILGLIPLSISGLFFKKFVKSR
jgi:hypothetical protein